MAFRECDLNGNAQPWFRRDYFRRNALRVTDCAILRSYLSSLFVLLQLKDYERERSRCTRHFRTSHVRASAWKQGSTARANGIPDRQLFPHLTQLLSLRSFLLFLRQPSSSKRRFNGPLFLSFRNTGERDNSDIIPPIPKQSGWTRIDPCRRTTRGCPEGSRANWRLPKRPGL